MFYIQKLIRFTAGPTSRIFSKVTQLSSWGGWIISALHIGIVGSSCFGCIVDRRALCSLFLLIKIMFSKKIMGIYCLFSLPSLFHRILRNGQMRWEKILHNHCSASLVFREMLNYSRLETKAMELSRRCRWMPFS